jgi:predicted ATP-grasp superfamily ATP-dependent carboligase
MHEAINHATPVVILRSGHHGGLGIVRSLGRLGVPVYSVDADRWEPAFSSRYCRGRFVLNVESGPPDRSVDGLIEIGRKVGGRPVLIPTTDQGAVWVADHAAALREAFRFPDQDAALVRSLCDKGRMQDLAHRSGVPTARSVMPRSKEDVERFIETAVFPVMVKATDAERLRRRAGGTKFLIQTSRELVDLYARVEDREQPNLLIQEFIPGEDWMFDGYFDGNSRCVLGVTGKKIRRFPVNTGVTSLGVCLRNEKVQKTTAEFMKAIGYRGILDIGYRYDRRDGEYKVLDVNPRIGCTFRLFAATNGMDVALALYLDMTGQPIAADAQAAEGRKWIVEDFDLFSALRSCRDGTLSLKEWVRSMRGVQEAACFALDDPLPFLFMGVADWCELFRWFRRTADARKGEPAASPGIEVPLSAGPVRTDIMPASK